MIPVPIIAAIVGALASTAGNAMASSIAQKEPGRPDPGALPLTEADRAKQESNVYANQPDVVAQYLMGAAARRQV